MNPIPTPALDDRLGWIEWHGGRRPAAADAIVEVKFRDPKLVTRFWPAGKWNWRHSLKTPRSDIIAYRIVEPNP